MMAVMLTHAVAALLFGAIALWQWNGSGHALPQRRLLLALALTALWALAVAGIGNADVATRVLLSARDLAWLWTIAGIAARARGQLPSSRLRLTAYGAAGLCAIVPALLAIVVTGLPDDAAARDPIGGTALVLRMLFAAAGAVLAHRVVMADERGHGGRRVLVAALALLWSTDLGNTAVAYFLGGWSVPMLAVRGATALLLAPVVAIAVQRGGAWQLSVSQAAAVRAIGLGATAVYALATAVLAGALGDAGEGGVARMIQAAVVIGAATSLLTLASTPWLRAWTRVVVAKHLFAHRYDYRAAWTGFGETLGDPVGAASLGSRVVQALAQLTESPAALLLARDGTDLRVAADWRWPGVGEGGGAMLVDHLEATRRIVDLGAVRMGDAPPEEIAAVPAWMLAQEEAWAIVPLLHFDRLVGAALLVAPPLPRPLDWEDLDLLTVAGRQAASFLAEERAAAALAEARRFEEFNRRFAFIMHDLKNLVSQTALVARNAERHGDDPAFRADMVATLRDTSQRMTALLARLGGHAAAVTDASAPVALLPLVRRIAAGMRAVHPMTVSGDAVDALAHAAALETALGHLVRNAIDASTSDAPVTFTTSCEAGAATIVVADAGCGMSAAFVRDELFRPFASAKPGGFGLGAFEARQLIEAMHGTLTVDSREGAGTRFTIRLPLVPALEAAA